MFHLKQVDEPDPSIAYVTREDHFDLYFTTPDVEGLAKALSKRGVSFSKALDVTPWGMKEFAIRDDQGHTLYFGQGEGE